MDKYTITARSARLTAGQLRLTAEQAKTRSTKLKALGDGIFEIIQPVEFKCGEVIGYEGGLPKSLADLMDSGVPAKKKSESKSKSKSKSDENPDSRLDENSDQTNNDPISSNPIDQQNTGMDS